MPPKHTELLEVVSMSEPDLTENWRPVIGYPKYEVSDLGRVRNSSTKKALKGTIDIGGYHRVNLYGPNDRRLMFVHRLVLESFIGPCPKKMECCHNDGNRTNNCLTNLRWDTRANNVKDRFRHGTIARGNQHGQAKLSEEDIVQIFKLRTRGYTLLRIAKTYGVDQTNISMILRRKAWRHVQIQAAPAR